MASSGFEKGEKPAAEVKDASELQLAAGEVGICRQQIVPSRPRPRASSASVAVPISSALPLPRTTRSAAAKGEKHPDHGRELPRQGPLRSLLGGFVRHPSLELPRATTAFRGSTYASIWIPGIEYYFVDQSDQQLWSEPGYDFQYDVRSDDELASFQPRAAPFWPNTSRATAGVPSRVIRTT